MRHQIHNIKNFIPRLCHVPSLRVHHHAHLLSKEIPKYTLTSKRLYATAASSKSPSSVKRFFYGIAILAGSGLLYFYVTDTRASIHRWLVVPVLRSLCRDAEDAHRVGNTALKRLWWLGLHPRERGQVEDAEDMTIDVFGYQLVNPIATSAGIDKDAEIMDPLFALGPSIVEVGGVTPRPQLGNAKPRVFRLPSQNALINRYGLNSRGADHMAVVLRQRVRHFAHKMGLGSDAEAERYVLDGHAQVPPGSLMPGRLLAINIAKNKETPDGDIDQIARDYVYCVEQLGPYADILVVNVSSPNTPGLRALQQSEPLTNILSRVVQAAQAVNRKKKPVVMVKVSPDEDTDSQIAGITSAVWKSGVDGVVVGNTTMSRPDPFPSGSRLSSIEEQLILEQGGFSGPQLFDKTLLLVRKYRESLDTRQRPSASGDHDRKHPDPSGKDFSLPKVVFATGGVTNGGQAVELLKAGASVAMVYTALVYGGSGTISRIKDEMRHESESKGS